MPEEYNGPVVIGVFGMAGNGKTTVCQLLEKHLTSIQRKAFAGPLKQVTGQMFGIPESVLYGSQVAKSEPNYYGKSARHWLQFIGTDIGRKIDPNIWVDRLRQSLLGLKIDYVTIEDGRFINEYKLLKKLPRHKRLLIHVARGNTADFGDKYPPSFPWTWINKCGKLIGLDICPVVHASEWEPWLLKLGYEFDVVIANDHDLFALEKQITDVVIPKLTRLVNTT